MTTITDETTFPEPRLAFLLNATGDVSQGFVIAEKEILFELRSTSIGEGLASLIATYYTFDVSYPRSTVAGSSLLFVQEILLERKEEQRRKKTAKYQAFINKLHVTQAQD